MIYLNDKHLNIVKEILAKFHIQNVYVFGSRTREHHKKFSDLDLAVKFQNNTPKDEIFFIKEAFENSTLPIKVDIVDLDDLENDFLKSIKKDFIQLEI